jgi:glycosyltransferase involved in cell wall biosynthesis
MADVPLVSIVTPSYNSARFIERTIQSVLTQGYPNIEHIVVDGASTDGTVDILRRYPHLRWVSEPDKGQSDALNKGFQMARGEIIGWLNADDTYNAGAIREAVAHLCARPATAMVYSHCDIIDEHDQVTGRCVALPFDFARELVDHRLPQQGAFMRAETLKDVSYLDPELHYIMDWDLFLRIGHKHRVDMVDATWANFRICKGTKTTSYPECFWIEAIRMFDRIYGLPDLPADALRVRNQAYARAYWSTGIILLSRFDESQRSLGQEYCRKAVRIYPLLDADLGFALAGITDWAVTSVPIHLGEDYVRLIFDALDLQPGIRRRMINQTLGQVHISRFLMAGKLAGLSEPEPAIRFRWLGSALRHDLRWLTNRGVYATFLRTAHKAARQYLSAS